MNEDRQFHDDLISGYLKGELTPDEIKELVNWLKIDKSNKKYFDEVCDIWVTAKASSKNPGHYAQEGFWKFTKQVSELTSGSKKISMVRTFLRYAAIFVLAFASGGFLFYYLGNKKEVKQEKTYSQLVVPLGSRAQFFLPDKTEVTLNAGSTLKYDNLYGQDQRMVSLEGEAYFKVAKDQEKPFIVKTSYLNVTALGTEFNVKAYSTDNTIETTLINGSVEIEPVNKNPGEDVTILKPNQKLTFFKEESKIVSETTEPVNKEKTEIKPVKVQKTIEVPRIKKEIVNTESVVSWKENRWIFEQQTLEQIATELERRFDVKINFESESLKSSRFTGIILAEPIEQVLEVMSISAPISYKLKGRVVTLSENKNIIELNKHLYKR